MITYELAKQLKEAGFPQTGEQGFDSEILDASQRSCINVYRPNAYYPSLSELVEACDEKCKDFALFHFSTNWVCGDYMPYEHDWIERAEGSTPEEAVANLWLALNENKKENN